jgi:hypothetical protein
MKTRTLQRIAEALWQQAAGEPKDIRLHELPKTVSPAAEKISAFVEELLREQHTHDLVLAKAVVIAEWATAHPEVIPSQHNADIMAARILKESQESVEEFRTALNKAYAELSMSGLLMEKQ